ncbi:PREDICTED: dynein regulatory complex protein 1, partial [Merops nubicus]|uniref:dynein regulatory complex protein 1 n=1 Tax=Merops nubicus TaxID=57421 RepID=UPI0004F03AAC
RLAKLLFEGTQMVTNIQVAADLRETQRRAEEAKLKLQRVEKLEREAKSSTERFEEITSRWASAKEMRIPEELWELLDQQQQQCTLLLEEKNRLIRELQQELRRKDEQYEEAIRQQSEEIHLLLERMEEQIRLLLRTYRHRLLQIEREFELERQELLETNRKKWDEGIQAHNAQELEYLHAWLRKVEESEKQLKQLRVQDEQDYNHMKLQLEKDVQNLERQLQQVKAAYQLNQEKLEYNLQVLKKQDEENTIIRAQQKRKINRLHSLLNDLRSKLAHQEKQFREESQSLAATCQSITGHCKELQRRMRHFALRDAEKFWELWLLNEEEAKGLVRRALDAGRVIHTQQLGLPWEEPHHWLLQVSPLGHHKEKRMETKLPAELAGEVLGTLGQEVEGREKEQEGVSRGGGKENTAEVEDRATPLQRVSKKTARRILELLSDESPLRIDSGDELYKLMDLFLKHKAQEVALSQSQGTAGGGGNTDPPEDKGDGRSGGSGGSSAQEDKPKASQSSLGSLPPLYIPADDVPKVLKAFLQDLGKLRVQDRSAKEVLLAQDSSKDWEYWAALTRVIPEPTLRLWDALAAALEGYHKILMHRSKLLTEATTLQQQNLELCLLLEQHLSSR